ncbi:MAG TPA: hydroxymethylbilane synthase [Thermoanaerobaculia bacterium]|nr:hydroxymethylbilane synthase [Thermoanaerobaculia bacterium]HXK66897.1 hydroxymethylbilane synthase [Thermoanaerobaculia bacterium]
MRLGTRRSPLALWQAHHVSAKLSDLGIEVELVPIVTQGDRIQDRALIEIGGKGLFLKEIEEALLEGTVDLAVHSLKDVPAFLPDGLVMSGYLSREDPRDAFAGKNGLTVRAIPEGGRVGTGSLRRAVQLLKLRPDLTIVPIRGNVETRLKKIETEDLHGAVLAAAGLHRLGLSDRITDLFSPEDMIPAVGQGILGLECRKGDASVLEAVSRIVDGSTMRLAEAERAFLGILEGSCQVPMGGHCWKEGDRFRMVGFVASPDGSFFTREEGEGGDPSALGMLLGQRILDQGAAEVMAHVDDYPHPF